MAERPRPILLKLPVATEHKIVGEEWKLRSAELAQWAMDTLVDRKGVWAIQSANA